jgi:hypothetical protein
MSTEIMMVNGLELTVMKIGSLIKTDLWKNDTPALMTYQLKKENVDFKNPKE